VCRWFFLVIFSVNNVQAQSKAPWVGADLVGNPCIGGRQGYGPFDYSQRQSIDPHHLDIVEGAHFTSEVENLVAGHSGYLDGDLDYTLRAWPNHHRALLSIARYQFKINSKLAKGKLITPPECYFQRAINFSPKDAVTASLYGYYLRETRHFKDAALAYEEALKLAPNTAKIEYAYSLLLIDLKQYDNALIQAKNAYQHGRPPQGLKNILIKLGVWK
jgi:tetratricopeptide (TPR) repeat protein